MAKHGRIVFSDRGASDRLPEWASAGVVMLEWLRQHGVWDELRERLKIQREGGYAGIDALVFLIYFFSSDLAVGVKEFSDRAREHHKQLAAVAERRRLPTQASMSRLLAAVDKERVQEFGSWLLLRAPGVLSVLQHPSVLTRDATGEGWHVFDWDPTVTTLRHRALPEFEGMPDGRRRSARLAKPGYPGRKRGEVQFSRSTLQHAGSGLWLGVEMAPGNGALREAFQTAIGQVIATCQHADLPLARVLLRADGAAGNVPFITACVEAGVHYITRLAHYQLLQALTVVGHLNEASWFDVPSSGSGPTRQAADLGRVVLEPAATSLRADGQPFESIETRIVVSRFPCSQNGRGAGLVLDGWQYELYGTDIAPDAWPEAEVVSGYYGRIGLENRFFQEDRELGLDRIFSYHLPGQQLATLIGLFVWNLYICRGMDLANPPQDLPAQRLAQRTPVTETPYLTTKPAASESDVTTGTAPSFELEPAIAALLHLEPTLEPEASTARQAHPAHTANASMSGLQNRPACSGVIADLHAALDEVDWEKTLANHNGWMWLTNEGSLRCPAQALLPLVRIGEVHGRGIRARFQADWGTCDSCELRQTCFQSNDPRYRRDVRLSLASPLAERLHAIWLDAPHQRRTRNRQGAQRTADGTQRQQTRPAGRTKPLSWQPPTPSSPGPKLAVTPPTLLPAELRKLTRETTRRVEVHLRIELPPLRPPLSRVLANSAAERQKRRLSWEERLRWNHLPDDAFVRMRMLGSGPLQRLLAVDPQALAKSA